jgi:hypothetical protein
MVKEHYLAFVSETFLDLLPRYERAYAGTNIAADYQTAIERRPAQIRGHQGFVEDAMNQRRVEIGKTQPVPNQSATMWAGSPSAVKLNPIR